MRWRKVITTAFAAITLATGTQAGSDDPLAAALDFHNNLRKYVAQNTPPSVSTAPTSQADRAQQATEADRSERSGGSDELPPLLLTIRFNESRGDYSAYNPTGCEGYGCGGAYQLHARYATVWGERAGYPGLSPNAATWPPSVQDAVAIKLFWSTSTPGYHWCAWTDYC